MVALLWLPKRHTLCEIWRKEKNSKDFDFWCFIMKRITTKQRSQVTKVCCTWLVVVHWVACLNTNRNAQRACNSLTAERRKPYERKKRQRERRGGYRWGETKVRKGQDDKMSSTQTLRVKITKWLSLSEMLFVVRVSLSDFITMQNNRKGNAVKPKRNWATEIHKHSIYTTE